MEWYLALALILVSFVILLLSGVPVAFSFLFVNILGVFLFWGGVVGLQQLILSVFSSVTLFALIPVPMFILLGEVMFRTGMGQAAIEALDEWLGRLPGRLSLLAVGGGALFATMSGSSMSGVAMLGSVLVPEMEKRGYKKPMTLGPILGSGGLSVMIPPTALGVLLAALAEVSVAALLMAIIMPGLVMAALFAIYIIIRCWLQPSIAPPYEVPPITLRKKSADFARYVLPLSVIVFLVIGSIFLGFATPSEAAALGALGAFVLAVVYGKLTWKTAWDSVHSSLEVIGMILMIFTGAIAFSQILGFTGASSRLGELAVSLPLPPVMLLIVMQLLLLAMGTFMDALPIMMVTIPIYYPIVRLIGWDPIWFAAIMLLNMEMASLSPPFGLSLFVMKGVAPPDTTMGDIYRAALPFFGLCAVAMILMILFPILSLWLPSVMW
ncbi:TRAP transporter large permease subunit [Chloroflexota bacterium]